ncbi:hypothetical protein [Streptomyces anulatus]|uniref:hypothetical protein n=1 Tax=Streptomyces anulatus TaxID=1892 RepID=UPI0039A414CA
MPIKQIARHKQLAPNTVRRLLRCEQPPYTASRTSSVAAPAWSCSSCNCRGRAWMSAAEIARRIDHQRSWPARCCSAGLSRQRCRRRPRARQLVCSTLAGPISVIRLVAHGLASA